MDNYSEGYTENKNSNGSINNISFAICQDPEKPMQITEALVISQMYDQDNYNYFKVKKAYLTYDPVSFKESGKNIHSSLGHAICKEYLEMPDSYGPLALSANKNLGSDPDFALKNFKIDQEYRKILKVIAPIHEKINDMTGGSYIIQRDYMYFNADKINPNELLSKGDLNNVSVFRRGQDVPEFSFEIKDEKIKFSVNHFFEGKRDSVDIKTFNINNDTQKIMDYLEKLNQERSPTALERKSLKDFEERDIPGILLEREMRLNSFNILSENTKEKIAGIKFEGDKAFFETSEKMDKNLKFISNLTKEDRKELYKIFGEYNNMFPNIVVSNDKPINSSTVISLKTKSKNTYEDNFEASNIEKAIKAYNTIEYLKNNALKSFERNYKSFTDNPKGQDLQSQFVKTSLQKDALSLNFFKKAGLIDIHKEDIAKVTFWANVDLKDNKSNEQNQTIFEATHHTDTLVVKTSKQVNNMIMVQVTSNDEVNPQLFLEIKTDKQRLQTSLNNNFTRSLKDLMVDINNQTRQENFKIHAIALDICQNMDLIKADPNNNKILQELDRNMSNINVLEKLPKSMFETSSKEKSKKDESR